MIRFINNVLEFILVVFLVLLFPNYIFSICPSNYVTDINRQLCVGRDNGINSLTFVECKYQLPNTNGNNNRVSLLLMFEKKALLSNSPPQQNNTFNCPFVAGMSDGTPSNFNDFPPINIDLVYNNYLIYSECPTIPSRPADMANKRMGIMALEQTSYNSLKSTDLCRGSVSPMDFEKNNPMAGILDLNSCVQTYFCKSVDTYFQVMQSTNNNNCESNNNNYICPTLPNSNHSSVLVYSQTIDIGDKLNITSSKCSTVCVHGFCNSRLSICQCDPGWTNIDCSQDVDECKQSDLNPCQLNSHCVNTLGSYQCVCNQGYKQNSNSCSDINECNENNLLCNQTTSYCVNNVGSYNCVCLNGFKLKQNISNECEDINECENEDICGDHGICQNTFGSFQCGCERGYLWNSTQCIDVDECTTRLAVCPLNALCINRIGHYDCKCPDNLLFLSDNKCQEFPPIYNVKHLGKGKIEMEGVGQFKYENFSILIGNIPCVKVEFATNGEKKLSCTIEQGLYIDGESIIFFVNSASKMVSTLRLPFITSINEVPTKGGYLELNVIGSVDERQMKLEINDKPCENLTLIDQGVLSCYVGPGTGIKSLVFESIGQVSSDGLMFSYQQPNITFHTLVGTEGGQIQIYSSNLGNDTSLINMTVDGEPCKNIQFIVPDESFQCLVSPSKYFHSVGELSIDSVKSLNNLLLIYDQKYSCNKSNCVNGNCIYGNCYCSGGWAGETCELYDRDVTDFTATSTGSSFRPHVTISARDGTWFELLVSRIKEVSPTHELVESYNLTMPHLAWTLVNQLPYWNYSITLNNNASIYVSIRMPNQNNSVTNDDYDEQQQQPTLFPVPPQVEYKIGPNITLTASAASIQYTISVFNWPFQSKYNTLRLLLNSNSSTANSDNRDCSIVNYSHFKTNTLDSDLIHSNSQPLQGVRGTDTIRPYIAVRGKELLWYKTYNGYTTLYARFLNKGLVDGELKTIRFNQVYRSTDLISQDNTATTGEMTIENGPEPIIVEMNLPYFESSCVVDPDYVIQIGRDRDSHAECMKRSEMSDKLLIPSVSITVAVVGCGTIISVVWFIIHKRRKNRAAPPSK
ncbi:hypothetical protein DFA_11938 [Cavenderia fasciculata]|uniref:EGF-like domain-containing protein n=1 Tax=Cavenderia fasciculata TaxID=261658 RepID=F4QEW2_CACFS|nr:uncharacterized protein DFA_11938 [Cavenderia fasciculata]EGG14169.1 hypothetical protein DFA_11938 [Cavenderia fasciculata]|eukprot:XP_004350877.1 hypothetical protein DFA_11938 [Cavenderia fasciculata]